MDVSQYLEIFIDETNEHLQNLNEQLLILEKEPEDENKIRIGNFLIHKEAEKAYIGDTNLKFDKREYLLL